MQALDHRNVARSWMGNFRVAQQNGDDEFAGVCIARARNHAVRAAALAGSYEACDWHAKYDELREAVVSAHQDKSVERLFALVGLA